MKKFTLMFSLLALMIVGLQAQAADVYVETDDPTFNVYTWDPNSFGDWPGKLITKIATQTEVNGTQYYKFSVEGSCIIFNKDGKQTQDIPLQDGDNFFTYPINGDFTQYETTNAPIQITSYTIAGGAALMGVEWDPTATQNDMTLQEDGTYKLVKEGVQLAAGDYDYKVVRDHSWDWSVPVGNDNQTLEITEDGKYNVTFTLTLGEQNVLTANAVKVEDVVIEHNYTVTGVAALMGSDWNTSDEANLMALQEDGTYKLVKEGVQLAAGDYDYKVVRDHSWDWSVPVGNDNQTLEITEDGKYNVTFTLTLGEENVLTAEAVKVEDVVIEHNYTIAGAEELMGSLWDVNDEANLMAVQEDGTYKLVKEGVQLAARGYDYKVVRDHSWDWSVPVGNDNQTLEITEDGKYNVTFTLTLGEQNVLTAEAEKVGDVVIEHNYTVAGVAALMGVEWDPTATQNDMTLQEDGTYKLVKEGVQLAAGDYDYKVVRDHSWDWSVPVGNDNQTLEITEDGKYNVTFTLTLGEENVLTAEAVKIVEPLQYLLHYGHGDVDDWQDAAFVAGEGTYEGKLVAKDVEFTADTQFGIKYGDIWYAGMPDNTDLYWIHAGWHNNIPLSSEEGVVNFIINEADTYTFVLTVGEEGITMDVEGFPVEVLVGDLNGDGVVDSLDVNIIVNMSLNKAPKTEAADLNGDQEVDGLDVNRLINIVLNK